MKLSELIILTATKDPDYVIDLIARSLENGEDIEMDIELLETILKLKQRHGSS